MPYSRNYSGDSGDMYDYLIEKRRKDLLTDIDKIRGYASGNFRPNDSQAQRYLYNIRSLCREILQRDEVPGIWKQSFKEIKRLMNTISDIYELSSSIQAEGHEPEYLSKILAICMNTMPKQDYSLNRS